MNTMSGNQVDMIVLEGGQFSSDRTFHYDNGLHYLALNDIILGRYAENRTMTIEPGVTIEFQPGTRLQVGLQSNGGNLVAEGTSGSPITFKAFNDTPGGWEGIYFHPYSDVYGSSSSMKYCIIEQGNNYNVYCNETSEPFFENCTFQNSLNDGLRETSSGPSSTAPEVHGCQFLNNGAYPINYLTWDCNSHLQGNTYSGNSPNYIALSGGQYSSNRTLYNDGIPYHVLSDIILGIYADHRRLTIEPGVILEFDPGTKLQVGLSSHGGDLYAEGNADSIIVFKPYNNIAGGWEGIYFHPYSDVYGSSSSLKYCNIEKGNNYNMYCESTVQPATFENCRLTDAVGDGLKLFDATIGDIKNSTVADNGGHGIYLDGTSHPVIGNDALLTNSFFGNGPFEVYNNTTYDINARYNYWGTGDSTMVATRIFDYYDNGTKGIVYFGDFAQVPSISEPTMTLSGNVWYANPSMTPFDGATLEIFDFGSSSVASTTTNGSGFYDFGTVTSGNYTMEITPADPYPTASVNGTDALAILQHFAQITPLLNIYMAAADVNASATINGTDALFVQKRWAGMITSFPAGDWLYNTTNLTVNGNQVTNDFEMLAFGDVNATFTPAKDWNGSVTLLHEGTQIIQSFMPFELVISVKDLIETGAISLGIYYPEEFIEITGAELLNTNGGALFTAENGLCRISWASLEAASYSAGDQLLILTCEAKDLSGMQEPILVEIYESSEFADPLAQVIENVILTVPELNTLAVGINQQVTEGLWLSTNYPNPFNKWTTISYAVPCDGKVKLTVVDLLGNTIRELVNENQLQGEYSVQFMAEGLEPGIYLYKLEFNNAENNVQLVNKMSVTR
jgi:hypothetical protein